MKNFGLENAKTSKTHMATTTKPDKDENDKNITLNFYSCSFFLAYRTLFPPF